MSENPEIPEPQKAPASDKPHPDGSPEQNGNGHRAEAVAAAEWMEGIEKQIKMLSLSQLALSIAVGGLVIMAVAKK